MSAFLKTHNFKIQIIILPNIFINPILKRLLIIIIIIIIIIIVKTTCVETTKSNIHLFFIHISSNPILLFLFIFT
jgi:hypothetical protein